MTNVKKSRKKLKLTQAELAHKLDVTVTTISRWENSGSSPNYKYIIKIEKMMGRSNELQRKNRKAN